uniref:phytanoyl-CoA dioxygenase family protein n=1 Tax=Rhodococcus qingshengii TaxID=334542 RepID=UPI001C4E2361|nr:phytanoyl-CoA dioxygenase family protein [Rhodococcus qingshengii]
MSIDTQNDTRKTRLEVVPNSMSLSDIGEIIARDGGVIVSEFFSQGEVERLNADIEQPLADLHFGSTNAVEHADDFHGARTKRLTNLISLSRAFREEWITNERILDWVDATLGPSSDTYWLTTAQVIEIHPGQKAQVLHRDAENYPMINNLGPTAPVVQINALVALTEYTSEMGATRVIPGSNRWADYSVPGNPDDTIAAEMEPGSALLTDGKVIHGGGANTTKDKARRGMAFSFNSGFLVPEEAYPFMVPLEVAKSLPPRVQSLIGFRSFHNEGHGGGTLWQVDYSELADYLGL